MSTNDLRGFYLKVWYGLVQDHKMSSDEADRLCDKYQQIIVDGYEDGEGPAKISDQLATQDKREAHEPGTKWSAEIRVAFNDENDPNDKWVKDYEGQSVWNFFDDLSDALPPHEAIKCVPDRYKDAFRDYCVYYGLKFPEESLAENENNWGTRNPQGFSTLNDILSENGFKCTFDNRFSDELVIKKGPIFWIAEYNTPPDMVVDAQKPWELFDGDKGTYIKNFKEPRELADYLILHQGLED